MTDDTAVASPFHAETDANEIEVNADEAMKHEPDEGQDKIEVETDDRIVEMSVLRDRSSTVEAKFKRLAKTCKGLADEFDKQERRSAQKHQKGEQMQLFKAPAKANMPTEKDRLAKLEAALAAAELLSEQPATKALSLLDDLKDLA